MTSQHNMNVANLYSELNRWVVTGDTDRALKASNRILHTAPDEKAAFQCKIVCLIQMSKFSEVLQAMKSKPQMASELAFEHAYCQYRVNNPMEAYKILQAADQKDLRIHELKAQVLYRLEKYDECKQIYQHIIKNTMDDYQNERETNLAAVYTGILADNPDKSNFPKFREDTYELYYNSACALVATRDFAGAERKLRSCEKMCYDQIMEDEGTEEDVDDELAIIRVQLAYCVQMQGREKEAQNLYQQVLKQKPDDIALVAVAGNNSAAINQSHNIFDSKKKLKVATSDAVEFKLNSAQRKAIAINNCLFQVTTGGPNFQPYCDALEKAYPDLHYMAVVATSIGYSKEGKLNEAVDLLTKTALTEKKHSVYLNLLAAHLLLMKDKRKSAATILQNMGDAKYLPGIVSALVTLYLGGGTQDRAAKILDETVDWYRQKKTSKHGLDRMYKEAALFHMRNDEPEAAAKCLEQLLSVDPNSKRIISQLVMAYAQIKSPKAKELSKRLPPVDTSKIDIDDLESCNWMMGLKQSRTKVGMETPPTTPREGGAVAVPYKKRAKKGRKGKLPKDYIIGVTPDPERWLPKYERTGFRKKRDRRSKDIIKGSQGASNASAETYDYSKMIGSQTESPRSEISTPNYSNKSHSGHRRKKGGRRS